MSIMHSSLMMEGTNRRRERKRGRERERKRESERKRERLGVRISHHHQSEVDSDVPCAGVRSLVIHDDEYHYINYEYH